MTHQSSIQRYRFLPMIAVITAAMNLFGCPLDDVEFIPCDNLDKIIIQGEQGKPIEITRDQAGLDQKYVLAFQSNTCPKGFLCQPIYSGYGHVCSEESIYGRCAYGLIECKGSCIDAAATHVQSCENNEMVCEDGYVDCDNIVGNGCEINLLLEDDEHCGSCSNNCKKNSKVCIKSKEGQLVCDVDRCAGTPETPNTCLVDGNNVCKNIHSNDAEHCGACNYKCEEHPIPNATSDTCISGVCQYTCPNDYVNVGTGNTADTINCINPINDNKYCGAKSREELGADCTAKSGFFCSNGICSESCSGSTTLCKGSCIDKSATHVSSCNASSITCETNYEDVDGIVTNGCEVNLVTDNNHCGTKNNKCTNGRTCSNGTCSCPNNLTYCKTGNSTYACIDKLSSNQYCGCDQNSQGNNCTISGQICTLGMCATSCAGNTTLCKGTCIDKSATHVNSCNASSITCETNYEDVDGIVTNGCEVNLLTDNNHCGSENNQCTDGRTCINGSCSCSTGLTYCKTGENTKACIDASNSNQYCGCDESKVGDNCNNKGQVCSSNACSTTCSGSTSLCKGSCIDKSATHVSSCNASSITCETNYEDVDGIVTNGCEVNLLTDNNHCGTKNNRCTNGRTCSNGTCSCPDNLTYCKTGNSTYACIDASSSNQYCGCSQNSQGNNCTISGQICSSGGCATTCSGSTSLCKGSCIDKSATHVSSCNASSITCETNYEDVDGIVTNGCEVNLLTDNNHCGTKNNTCTGGRTCINGICATQCPSTQILCSGKCFSQKVLNLLNRIFDSSEGTVCACKPGYSEPDIPMDPCI